MGDFLDELSDIHDKVRNFIGTGDVEGLRAFVKPILEASDDVEKLNRVVTVRLVLKNFPGVFVFPKPEKLLPEFEEIKEQFRLERKRMESIIDELK